jgi:magnesium-transporting ATPase (P-type)
VQRILPKIKVAGELDVFCFDKTGTLTENHLGFAGALPVREGRTDSLVADLSCLANDDPMAVGVATCHSIALVDGQLAGNSTDLSVFESLNWVNKSCFRRKHGLIGVYTEPPITYYWTVTLIFDHSYLFGKLTSSKIADTKVSGF